MKRLTRSSEEDIYYGEIEDSTDSYNGLGLKINSYGEIYYGEWVNNARNGFGANVYLMGEFGLVNGRKIRLYRMVF